jgi:hypothetical protein
MRAWFALVVVASALFVASPAGAVGQCKSSAVAVDFPTLCARAMGDGVAATCLVIQYGEGKGTAMNGKLRSGVEFLVLRFNCQADYLKELESNSDVWTTVNVSALLRGTLWGIPGPKVTRAQLAKERSYFRSLVNGQASD